MRETPVPEMVDRVARALESQLDVAEMVMADPMTLRRLKAKRLARVAIEAMRNPPEHVADALNNVPGGFGPGAWEVGLDAALSSPAPTEEG